MDSWDAEWLFEQIVADKMNQLDNGLIEVPLDAMHELHDALGLSENQTCVIGLDLEESEESIYNFVLVNNSDELARVVITGVYFYDESSEDCEKITGEELLYQAVSRNLLAGKTLICGCMLIDQDGVIYLQGMHSEDIGVEFCIDPNDRQAGYQLMTTDGSCSFNLWRFENKLMISPSLITYWDGLPS